MFQFLVDLTRSSVNYLRDTFRSNHSDSDPTQLTLTASQKHSHAYKEKYPPGTRLSHSKSYDEATWEQIEEVTVKVRVLVREWGPYREIRELLEESWDVSESVNTRDHNGYNLLQYAIIANRPNVVQYLVRQGAEINLPTCGRPLHLAAKLGHTEIMRILLEYNADPDVLSTVCHPEQHIDTKIVYTDSRNWSAECVNDLYTPENQYLWLFEYPLYFAITSDNVECVKLCLQQGITQIMSRASPLHIACILGSFRCAQYFLENSHKDVHLVDRKGDLPIQAAVRWGKHFVEYLVLKGASVLVNNSHNETLLHILYSEATSNVGLAETTAYLLDCGLSLKINVVDSVGNSALHTLLRRLQQSPPKAPSRCFIVEDDARQTETETPQIGTDSASSSRTEDTPRDEARDCLGFFVEEASSVESEVKSCLGPLSLLLRHNSWPDPSPVHSDASFTEEEWEYMSCVELLLSAGANPNISNNKTGDTSLHMLARVASKSISDWQVPRSYCSFRLVHRLLELLLKKGANHRLVNNAQSTVLGLFVVNGCGALFAQRPGFGKFDLPDEIEVHNFMVCLRLFKRYGGEFNTVGYLGSECLIHTVLDHVDKIDQLQHAGFIIHEQQDLGRAFLTHILSVLECLLDCGCHPNVCKYVQSDLHTYYYKVMSKHTILPITLIQRGVLLLLQHGADPNIGGKHIPMSVFRYRSSHSYWPVYPLLHVLNTIGSKDLQDREPDLFTLLHIFYNSMEESNARQCLFHYLEYDRFRGRTSKYPELDEYLMDMLNNPRSLKQICASFIFSVLARRHVCELNKLPLPNTIKKFILSIQY